MPSPALSSLPPTLPSSLSSPSSPSAPLIPSMSGPLCSRHLTSSCLFLEIRFLSAERGCSEKQMDNLLVQATWVFVLCARRLLLIKHGTRFDAKQRGPQPNGETCSSNISKEGVRGSATEEETNRRPASELEGVLD